MRILLYICVFLFCLVAAELWAVRIVIGRIGLWPAIAIILGTGALGAVIARENAKTALSDLASGNRSSGPPAKRLIDAIVFLMAAMLLIVPGLITDIAGLILLLPITRNAIFNSVRRQYERTVSGSAENAERADKTPFPEDGDVIDVEAEEES